MSKARNRMRNTRISHGIHINGQYVNIDFARIVYRCAVCYGPLKRHNAGLACVNDPAHRRFIHQQDVEAIETQQAKDLADVESAYEIKDGQIVAKGEN